MDNLYFLTLTDRCATFFINENNALSLFYYTFQDNKYSLYFLHYFYAYNDTVSVIVKLGAIFEKYSLRSLPFQPPHFFSYCYEFINSLYYQTYHISYYILSYYIFLIFILIYLFSKLSSYANSYYFASYASIFRKSRWFVSDLKLINLARISFMFNLASTFFIISTLIFVGSLLFFLYGNNLWLALANTLKTPLTLKVGGFNFWLDTLDVNTLINQINKSNKLDFHLYKLYNADLRPTKPVLYNLDRNAIERFFIDPAKLKMLEKKGFFEQLSNGWRAWREQVRLEREELQRIELINRKNSYMYKLINDLSKLLKD